MDACGAAFDLRYASIDRINSKRGYDKGNCRIIAMVFKYLKRNAFHDKQGLGYVAHAQSKEEEIKAAAFPPSPPPSRPRSPAQHPARASAAPSFPPASPLRSAHSRRGASNSNDDSDDSESSASSSSSASSVASRPRRQPLRRAAGRRPGEESEESDAASQSDSSSPSRPVRPVPRCRNARTPSMTWSQPSPRSAVAARRGPQRRRARAAVTVFSPSASPSPAQEEVLAGRPIELEPLAQCRFLIAMARPDTPQPEKSSNSLFREIRSTPVDGHCGFWAIGLQIGMAAMEVRAAVWRWAQATFAPGSPELERHRRRLLCP